MTSDQDDAKLLLFLTNGKPIRPRREPYSKPRELSEVTDPDLLDPYDRLFYNENPQRSKETVALCSFYWSEEFSYDDAKAWFDVGAEYDDFPLLVEFKRAGIPTDVAARQFVRRGVPTGMTIFQAAVNQQITPATVRQMMDRHEQRRGETA